MAELSVLEAIERTCQRSKDYTDEQIQNVDNKLNDGLDRLDQEDVNISQRVDDLEGGLGETYQRTETNRNDIAKQEIQLSKVEKQIENINQHINEEYFITNEEISNIKDIPEGVCDYAQVASIGGLSHKSENFITYPYTDGAEQIAFLKENGINIYLHNNNGSFTISAKGQNAGYVWYTLATDLHLPTGLYTMAALNNEVGDWTHYISIEITNTNEVSRNEYQYTEPISFSLGEGEYIKKIALVFNSECNLTKPKVVMPMLSAGDKPKQYEPNFQQLIDNKTIVIKSVGKNILPSDVHDFNSWHIDEVNQNHRIYHLDIEEEGYYVLSSSTSASDTSGLYLYLQKKQPGYNYTSTNSALNNQSLKQNGYFIANTANLNPLYFQHSKGDKWRLWAANTPEALSIIKDIQIQKVDELTDKPAYEEYTETILEIPDTLTKDLPDYGCGIDGCYNTIDLENGVYIQRVAKKQITSKTYWWYYKSGPKDGYVYCCAPKVDPALEYQSSICSHFINIVACWGEDASVNKGYKGPGYYSDHNTVEASSTLYFKTHIPPADAINPGASTEASERAANWKKYLEDKKIVMDVVYKLANPIITPLPEEFDEFLSIKDKKYVKFETNTSKAIPNTVTFLSKEV